MSTRAAAAVRPCTCVLPCMTTISCATCHSKVKMPIPTLCVVHAPTNVNLRGDDDDARVSNAEERVKFAWGINTDDHAAANDNDVSLQFSGGAVTFTLRPRDAREFFRIDTTTTTTTHTSTGTSRHGGVAMTLEIDAAFHYASVTLAGVLYVSLRGRENFDALVKTLDEIQAHLRRVTTIDGA